jgi:nucleolar protein 9
MPHEHALAASLYGRFFAKRLHLSLLHRRPEEWRTLQVRQQAEQREKTQARQDGAQLVATTSAADVDISKQQSTKRGREENTDEVWGSRKRKREVDEIGALFEGVKENRFGKVGLPLKAGGVDRIGAPLPDNILEAIKAAPKGEAKVRRKQNP